MKPVVRHRFLVIVAMFFASIACHAQEITPGAMQPAKYLPLLKGKKVGLVVNQTSMVGNEHLLDFLTGKGISVSTIFAPEHGFRGEIEAGKKVADTKDEKTGIKIVSLYGDHKKPSKEELSELDVVVYDIQDLGCRFFTYISTLFYAMEACAENNVPLVVFDRPNPNGDYVDGPVLQPSMKSFVGMVPVPVVYGCTPGELALMINGEKWLPRKLSCDLTVINVANYTHSSRYDLPVKPSPNLPNNISVRLYPSLCLFEATKVSIGRGTGFPFQVIGFPDENFGSFSFTPVSIDGVSKNPLHEGKVCYGVDLRQEKELPRFTLAFLLNFRSRFKSPGEFWSSERWIGLLTGDPEFYSQIEKGMSEEQIRATWEPALQNYKAMRKNYLLYPDMH